MVMGLFKEKMSKRERRRLRKVKTGFCGSSGKDTNILGVNTKNYAEKCGWCDDQSADLKIEIPVEIYTVWLTLMLRMEKKEWGGVFDVKDGIVSNFRIPKQTVESAACEFLEDLGGNGVIHSHHSMGSFHSGQDDRACRNNYYCSIVISDNGMICTCKVNLPCTGFGYKSAKLIISGCPSIDMSLFHLMQCVYGKGYTVKDFRGGHWENGVWVYDTSKPDVEGGAEGFSFYKKSGPHICDFCTGQFTGVYWQLNDQDATIICPSCKDFEEKQGNTFYKFLEV